MRYVDTPSHNHFFEHTKYTTTWNAVGDVRANGSATLQGTWVVDSAILTVAHNNIIMFLK